MAGRLGGRGGRGGRGGFQASEGDWPCPNPGCSNVNFARRDKCNRCQTPRPEGAGGSGGAPKLTGALDVRGPPGLFQAGDWACITCGNINWERRNECNICKSAKPGMPGLDEKRDGAGGGFNERQERVASAKAEVDEDGYDDFGMKKRVKASKAEREAAALARLHQSYSGIIQPPGSASTAAPASLMAPSRNYLPAPGTSKPVAPLADKPAQSSPPKRDANSEKKRRSRSPERSRRDPASTSSRRSRSRSRDRDRDRRRRSPSRDRNRSRQRSRSRSRGRDHRDSRRR